MSQPRSTAGLIWDQIRYQNKIFWRTPIAAFFTLVFPLMLLVLFTAIFGNDPGPGGVRPIQYYAPNLAVFSAVSATYTNLAIGTAFARDKGILKRVRGTPLPPWVYIAGRIGSATYIALLAMVVMMGVGVAVYGIQLEWAGLPASALAFVVGVLCFSALGLLVATLAPSGDSSPAIANATLLPLAFVSDIFIPMTDPPRWMEIVGNTFPLKHFAVAFREPLSSLSTGPGVVWPSLSVVALWGAAAFLLTVRYFRWDPKERRTERRRRQPVGG